MDSNKIKQAIEMAKQNPDSQFATELRRRIESGAFDNELHNAGLSQYATKPPETSMVGDIAKGIYQSVAGQLVKPAARATEAITSLVAPQSEAAKGYELMRQEGQSQNIGGVEVPAVKQFGQGAGRQIIGEGLETASYLIPYGKVAGGVKALTGSKVAGNIVAGATGGYTGDVAFGLQGQGSVGEAVKPGLGTALGVGIPAVSGGVQKISSLINKPIDTTETIGKILQGKTKDVKIGQKALSSIDLTGVKTRSELSQKLSSAMDDQMRSVDDILSRDPKKYSMGELMINEVDDAGTPITIDYISSAIKDLGELYKTSGDDVAYSNLGNLNRKIMTEGLTRQEVNNLARQYSEEFGSKAFSKTGEQLTSVSAQKAENVRKGLKYIARGSDEIGQEATQADKLYSAMSNTKALIDKGVEGVNKLKQRVNDRTLLEKAGRNVVNIINAISGGALKGAASAVFPSNVGLKTMNWLDLEKSLQNDLKLLQKANSIKTESGVIKFLKDNASKFKFPGDMAVDDVTESAKKVSQRIKETPGKQGGYINIGQSADENILSKTNTTNITPKTSNISKSITQNSNIENILNIPEEKLKGLPVTYLGDDYKVISQSGVRGDMVIIEGKKGQLRVPKTQVSITDLTKEPVLDTLNPTGSIFVEYTPKERATIKLAPNITTLDKTMGRPASEMVTIYRGAPKIQKSIVPGDFITTNYELAKSYSSGKILSKRVKLSDILDDIESPLGEEYLYRPKK